MAEIALRTYLQDIERLLAREAYDEAIAHCRHILTYFPMNVDTYRLLGKALLEKGQHLDAADVFQRILSADPSDFVSHVGLAIIREEDGVLDQAIWHMERAYELQPNNTAILDELRRLYSKRDGRDPGRIGLTRAALARLYAQGDLFEQAIAELQKALADDPERVDVHLLLAETLWRDEQQDQAAARSRLVLARLPNCISANAILARVALADEDEAGAAPYLELLKALAPYQAAEIQPSSDGQEPRLPRLEMQSPAPATQVGEGGADWVRELGSAFGEEAGSEAVAAASPAAEEELPDWLREMAALLPDISLADAAPGPEPGAETGNQAAAPDLVTLAGSPAPSDSLAELLASASSFEPPAAAVASASSASASGETPDWLREAMEEIPDFVEADLSEGEATVASAAWSSPAGEMPDWLREAAAEVEAEIEPQPTQVGQEPTAAAIPDWLRAPLEEMQAPAEAGPPAPEAEPVEVEVAAPVAAATVEAPVEVQAEAPVQAEAGPTEAALAWLDQIAAQPEEGATGEPAGVVEIPEWLREPAAPTPEAGEVPEWIAQALSEPVDTTAPVAVEPPPALEVPAAEMEPAQPVETPAAEVTPAEPLAAAAVEGELPEWLAAPAAEAPAAEALPPIEVAVPAAEAGPIGPPEVPVPEAGLPAAEALPPVEAPLMEAAAPVVEAEEPKPPAAPAETVVAEAAESIAPVEAAEAEAAPAESAGPAGQLALARSQAEAGAWDAALAAYEQLINDAVLVADVIADLEAAAPQAGSSRLYTLLGDAYTQKGRLKKAMEAYQAALRSLKK